MKKWIKKRWKALLIVLILAVFFIYPPVVLAEIRIDYEDEESMEGKHWKAMASFSDYAGLNSVKKSYRKPGEARIFFWDLRFRDGQTLKRMDPCDFDLEDEIRIQGMTFYINGFAAGELSAEELLTAFTPNDQAEIYLTESGSLGILITGEDSQLFPTEQFQTFYREIAVRYARTGILYFLPLLAAVVFAVAFYRREIWMKREGRFNLAVDTLLYLAGVAAVILVATGAFTGSSEVNPDESESIYSVQYYMTHWEVPDARDLPAEAYSAFGTARLTELTLFYQLAAQVARFFTFEHGTRLFSVLLFAGLFYLAFWKRRQAPALRAALFLTPQLWYLYTYCTSDAWDFAIGLLVLYQLTASGSMLRQLLEGKNTAEAVADRDAIAAFSPGGGRFFSSIRDFFKKPAVQILLLGFLFANIFMAKQNYYVLAIYAFCILLAELLAAPGEERKRRFIICLSLAASALFFLGLRYIPEFLHYGFRRQAVLRELQEQLAIPKLNPASSPEEQSSAFNLYGKGVTLGELLSNKSFYKTLYRSFVGTYGSLQFPSPDWYGCIMGVLYLVLLSGCCLPILREKRQALRKGKLGLLGLCVFVSWALVIYNAWFIDFQAQGRYLLPVLIFVAHAAVLRPETIKSRWFSLLLCVTAVLSLYSFAVYCVPNIGPPY